MALQASAQERLLVFAAASLKNALDEANAAAPLQAVASYAASSALARQIERGAPAQVFISADMEWMDYLEGKGLLQRGTRRNLLGNRLVWVVPAAAPMPREPLSALGAAGRLALADPDHVPAGKYAKAALQRLGVWPAVERRVAAAQNVRAALALVARGEAPLGIVYETDAKAEPKVKLAGHIDAASHPAAAVRGATLEARRYLDYLASPAAAEIFRKHGFHVPG
jgi:molybdate transport system substrate-binding protein